MADSLLGRLNELRQADRVLLAAGQTTAEQWFRRCLLLKSLGLHSLAVMDSREAAAVFGLPQGVYDCIDSHSAAVPAVDGTDAPYAAYFAGLAEADRVLCADYVDPMAYNRRAVALEKLGLFHLALRDYRYAFHHVRQDERAAAFVRTNAAMLLLSLGDFAGGWPLYESRWQANYERDPRDFDLPHWQGGGLDGKTLMLYFEQGLGDAFQFMRYALQLHQAGVPLLFYFHGNFQPFIRYNLERYGLACTTDYRSRNDIGGYTSIMSLPYFLGMNAHNVPFADSAYLDTPSEYRSRWEEELGPPERRRVGVFWQSLSSHKDGRARNIPFVEWAPVWAQDAEFHCLQQEITEADQQAAAAVPQLRLWGSRLGSFFDTAALIAQMDVVLSVDTSVAHLAAAMGKPTWILLPYRCDFRWQTEGDGSIWYRSARLFRQQADWRWAPVLAQVAQALADEWTGMPRSDGLKGKAV